MRFKKGDYFIVPNREHLSGLDPQTQTVFMWLCARADNDGRCFPSFTNLEKTCGMSRPTISNRVEKLEKLGFIKKKVGNYTTSNSYFIQLLPSKADLLPSKGGLPEVVKEVNSNNNHINNNHKKGNNKVVSSLIEVVEDKPKKKSKDYKNKQALKLREWAYQQIEDTYGHYPVINQGDYFVLVKALKFLSEEDIKIMVEDALSKGEGQTVRSIFTDRQIDLYRQENI